jgi:hypothetical protein
VRRYALMYSDALLELAEVLSINLFLDEDEARTIRAYELALLIRIVTLDAKI